MENQTIELRSLNFDKSGDLSTTRIPLINNLNNSKNKESDCHVKLEREFRKLNSITNLKSIMFFIYYCLFFDVIFNIFRAYSLIQCILDILNLIASVVLFIDYIISLSNIVFYIRIIIKYGEEMKKLQKQKEDEKEIIHKVEKKKIYVEKNFIDYEMTINSTTKSIKKCTNFRLITSILSYLNYILLIKFNRSFNTYEYLNILVILTEYFLMMKLSFYYSIIIRLEAYKTAYGFEDPN